MKVRTDLSRVDMFFIGVQKGCTLPVGMSFIGHKRTKGCTMPVEMSFTMAQKDKRVHVAG